MDLQHKHLGTMVCGVGVPGQASISLYVNPKRSVSIYIYIYMSALILLRASCILPNSMWLFCNKAIAFGLASSTLVTPWLLAGSGFFAWLQSLDLVGESLEDFFQAGPLLGLPSLLLLGAEQEGGSHSGAQLLAWPSWPSSAAGLSKRPEAWLLPAGLQAASGSFSVAGCLTGSRSWTRQQAG